ncbi:transcriptional regulator [Agrobacterium sp. SOY23]|uniref:transcriptional regulator GutM n=1 Tax=Agrobacterium sp. SOY23 TaxID=3014555 RepID=UPI0022AF8E7D|nr:transcriptional regulator GutM [Agrobacterium sp. SOY23]MCZ4433247.1 transcriptional regulator [Agrobacterium sp. SOY23]
MAIWQWALLGLGFVWAIQALGVWRQMQHYTDVFKGITHQFNDGFVGAGHARGRFRKGAIAMVVIGPDLLVKRLLTMTGRSVFAKFQRNQHFEGMTLEALKHAQAKGNQSCVDAAIALAIAQAEAVREREIDRGAQTA